MSVSRLVQNVLATVVVILLPSLWLSHIFGRAFWETGRERVILMLVLAVAYVLGALWLEWRRRGGPTRLCELGFAAGMPPALVAVLFWRLGWPASRPVLVLAAGTALALLALIYLVPAIHRLKPALLGAVVLAAGTVHLAYPLGYLPPTPRSSASESSVNTSLYTLRLRSFVRPVPAPLQTGGALARLWDDYLLATGDGLLFRFDATDSTDRLVLRPLAPRVPTNPGDFRRDVAGLGLQEPWFRVADVFAQLAGDRLRLFATYHWWYPDRRCYVMRLSMLETDRLALDTLRRDAAWTTLFETTPCLAIEPVPGSPAFFAGLQIGGRIDLLGDALLVTVGDHEFDGVSVPVSWSQDSSASYGKVVTVHPDTRAVELFSIGHRNPQGLHVDAAGGIWSTEHGPRGGDELNRLERGGNYGWPIVTYGVDYQSHEWPFNPRQGSHVGYAEPVYAWVPAIGVSNLIRVTGSRFGLWEGDLLVGTLRDHALWRLRLTGDRVVVAEPIAVGVQVRDLLEGHDGELLVWDDQYPGPTILIITTDLDPTSGPALFARCAGCHQLGNGRSHGIGPDLAGVVGRGIGAAAGFVYSPALARLGGTWTDERLDAFLRDPVAAAPGTAMRVPGVANAEHRRMIIEYLAGRR